MRNTENNVTVTVCGGRQVLDSPGDPLVSYVNFQALRCTPETKILLYVNCNFKLFLILNKQTNQVECSETIHS